VSVITPQQALDYLERWKIVREREARELHATSMEERARQLGVLMTSRTLFECDPGREHLVEEVRQRWMRIHRAQGG
jgi:hypothetical protein